MKKIYLILLLFSFLIGQAQKSAPIAGDASTLLDLLYKDYNVVNPDNRDEELVKDRAKVIGIFKSYLIDYKYEVKEVNPENINNLRLTYLKTNESLALLLKKSSFSTDDIKEINTLKNNQSKENYFKALANKDNFQLDDLKNKYTTLKNQYVVCILESFIGKYKAIQDNAIDSYSKNNNALSYQKGLLFSGGDILMDAIDGLSRFIAKRIKEELTINAIQKIQDYLKKPEEHGYLYELQVVLPTTVSYLKSFKSEQLLNFSDDLKQYIENDINHLVENAVNLKTTPRIADAIKNRPDLDFAFEGLEILTQISKIKSPVDYFEILENSRNLSRWREDSNPTKFKISQSLRMSTMLAYSLTLVENGEVKFVTTDFISNYGNQKEFGFLYFGFLHQQNVNYFGIKADVDFPLNLGKIVEKKDTIENSAVFLKQHIVPIINNAEKIQAQLLALKKVNKNDEKPDYNDMYGMVNNIISFSEQVAVSGQWLVDSNLIDNTSKFKDFFAATKPYFSVARLANEITLDLHQKKYTNAITKAIEIPFYLNIDSNSLTIIDKVKNKMVQVQQLTPVIELLSKDKKMSDSNKVVMQSLLKKQVNVITILKLNLVPDEAMMPIVESIDALLKEIKKDTINIDSYNQQINRLKASIVDNRDKVLNHYNIKTTELKEEIKKQLEDQKLQSTVYDYFEKKLDELIDQTYKYYVVKEEVKIDAEQELNEVYQAFLPQLLTQKNIKNNSKLVSFIHFVNDIAVADGPEAYQKAIEAFALPVGSSSQKETAKYYYSINAFPGMLVGSEKSEGIETATFIGFTAPVGLYIQPWGSFKCGANLGVFFPIIDIAAPVRLRLDSTSDTKALPNFKVDDIISPGVYAVYGFKNTPFTLNFGFQYGPKLRDIPSEITGELKTIDSYRIGFGITLDIPLFNIASKYKD